MVQKRIRNLLVIAAIAAVGTVSTTTVVAEFNNGCNEFTCPDTWWAPMTDDDKIDYVANMTGVSRDDAKAAYAEAEGDVLESIELLGTNVYSQP